MEIACQRHEHVDQTKTGSRLNYSTVARINMEWYLPITVLPAVGLLIMSTTGQMMNLSMEVGSL